MPPTTHNIKNNNKRINPKCLSFAFIFILPYHVLRFVFKRVIFLIQSRNLTRLFFNNKLVTSARFKNLYKSQTRLIKINEYKRRQAPVGIRITHRAFGRDWRYPITSKFRA